MTYTGINRKVFITFYQGDRPEVDAFIDRWAVKEGVFIPKVLGVSSNDDFINSTDTDYVMRRIREKYLGDSTVTIVLLGRCTHSRRYVDWELKSSLRRGSYTPNGLIGIILPSKGTEAYLPLRFQENWSKGHRNCYARLWVTPSSAQQLGGWIESAFQARTALAHLIQNSAEMAKYNRQCQVHGVTH